MALFLPVQLTYTLSFRIGKGMLVDLDSTIGPRVARLEEEARTQPLNKSSHGHSLSST